MAHPMEAFLAAKNPLIGQRYFVHNLYCRREKKHKSLCNMIYLDLSEMQGRKHYKLLFGSSLKSYLIQLSSEISSS